MQIRTVPEAMQILSGPQVYALSMLGDFAQPMTIAFRLAPPSYSLLTLRALLVSRPRRSDLARSFLLDGPVALLLVIPAPIAVAWRGT